MYKRQQLQSLSDDVVFAEGVAELQTVITALGQFGIPEQNYKIDLTIARGLDYYTGTVSVSYTHLDVYKRQLL